jgi:hypothetical protein
VFNSCRTHLIGNNSIFQIEQWSNGVQIAFIYWFLYNLATQHFFRLIPCCKHFSHSLSSFGGFMITSVQPHGFCVSKASLEHKIEPFGMKNSNQIKWCGVENI